ncbi:VOC family protein [Haloechinothrix sp. LS1_15]|uniref:VOC family protein n=1 Tax=Haloechinothrix sp. LS1_15 TaxID=2652248 RepID=UPI002947A53C|nr:VOC family protein [Haloechinothrix sp. LS1_15]MDV6014654.1 VOC family protein [Haloechinothrix sp. LS1_15]
MDKITPFLWFDSEAVEAAEFYTGIFANSRITDTTYAGEGGMLPAGSVLTVTFELDGRSFVALNGGPHHTFNDAISFHVGGEDQAEVDRLWEALTDGGKEVECGWLKDRYGVSWQVVPSVLHEMLGDDDPNKVQAVTTAMLGMVKIDIATLREAYDGA